MNVALAVSNGDPLIVLGAPGGDLELTPGQALVLGGGAVPLMLAIHLHVAHVTARLSAAVIRSARDRAIVAYAGATWARQAQDREGALQETVSTLSAESSTLAVFLCSFVSSSVGLLALLLAAVVVSPVVTLVVLVFGVLIVVALRPIGRLTQRTARSYVAKNSDFTEGISQWTNLAMELRVFGVENIEIARLTDHNEATATALAKSRFTSRLGSDLYKDLAILFLVLAVAVFYRLGDVDVVAVGAVVLLIVRSLSYAQQTSTAMQKVNELGPNLDALLIRLDSLENAAERTGTQTIDTVGPIALRNLGYEYEPGRPGIEGITLDIAAGEVVGVIGPSGGGKSTLVQVLLRLRTPTSGTLTVSGIPYEDVAPESWHDLVTLVPQEPKLFQATVADNIAFLRPYVSRQQVELAAELAHVAEDIDALPAGYDTELGPRGAGLSGGQKQRIAIARALLGTPQLLVLDEPTSALDVRSEKLLQETIHGLKGRVTLVIVAHRLTTLTCCDRVVGIAHGRIQVIGTLEEALSKIAFEGDTPLSRP